MSLLKKLTATCTFIGLSRKLAEGALLRECWKLYHKFYCTSFPSIAIRTLHFFGEVIPLSCFIYRVNILHRHCLTKLIKGWKNNNLAMMTTLA